MPDRTKLRVGDRIRLLSVPDLDLQQRQRELQQGLHDAGWTADTIERIMTVSPEVTISEVDEYDSPWYEAQLLDDQGKIEYHFLAVLDDESWEYC
jgi:hypothetical protein